VKRARISWIDEYYQAIMIDDDSRIHGIYLLTAVEPPSVIWIIYGSAYSAKSPINEPYAPSKFWNSLRKCRAFINILPTNLVRQNRVYNGSHEKNVVAKRALRPIPLKGLEMYSIVVF
jgi:hypothetical protein